MLITQRLGLNTQGGSLGLTWDAVYTLTTALAGRELKKEDLEKLASAFIDVLIKANEFKRDSQRPPAYLWKDEGFQKAMMRYYDAVVALGVTEENARIVGGNLAESAQQIVGRNRSILYPIPPGDPRPR